MPGPDLLPALSSSAPASRRPCPAPGDPMRPALLPAFLAMCSLVLCQGTIFVPDNQANVGTCNAIPLASSFAPSETYVARIPASYMDPILRRIDDIAFAPCNTTTFTASNLQMGLGHVPNPLPLPFV